MKKSAVKFLILTGLVKVALCVIFGRNIYIAQEKTWSEARKYCRERYTDLSSISSQKEDEELLNETQPWNRTVWIGLYKDASDTWKWSGGENTVFFKWSGVGAKTENKCVVQDRNGWHKMNCENNKFHFFCFKNKLVLVKENKTWEEAIEQCRHEHTDLVSLSQKVAMRKVLWFSMEAQTDQVWIGLRYLADNWLWLNGKGMKYQAWSQGKTPQCPAWNLHCGALSLEGQHWDSRDCTDKLNFVCY